MSGVGRKVCVLVNRKTAENRGKSLLKRAAGEVPGNLTGLICPGGRREQRGGIQSKHKGNSGEPHSITPRCNGGGKSAGGALVGGLDGSVDGMVLEGRGKK